jgi:Arc/MetJ-type ribon-helix-helix transcriptional regulator
MKDLYDVVRVLLNQAPNISEAIKDAARDVLDQADPKVKQAAEDAAAVADRAERAELERLQQKFAARQSDGDGKDTPADA